MFVRIMILYSYIEGINQLLVIYFLFLKKKNNKASKWTQNKVENGKVGRKECYIILQSSQAICIKSTARKGGQSGMSFTSHYKSDLLSIYFFYEKRELLLVTSTAITVGMNVFKNTFSHYKLSTNQ